MSKPKLTSLLFLGFIGRIAETLTNQKRVSMSGNRVDNNFICSSVTVTVFTSLFKFLPCLLKLSLFGCFLRFEFGIFFTKTFNLFFQGFFMGGESTFFIAFSSKLFN